MKPSPSPAPNTTTLYRNDPAQAHRRVLWHLLWGIALLALCFIALFTDASVTTMAGLVLAAIPSLGAFGLQTLPQPPTSWPQPAPPSPMWTIWLWCIFPVLATALTGGLNGPLAGLVFAPVAGGLALRTPGSERGLFYGLAASAIGVLTSGLLHPVLPVAEASPLLVTCLGLLVLVFGLVAAHNSRHSANAIPITLARMESALSEQPGLTIVLSPSGRTMAAYGSAPPAIDVDALFDTTDNEGGLIDAVHPPDRPAVRAALSRAQAGQAAQVRFTPRAALDRRVLLVVRRMQGDSRRIAAIMLDATLQHARETELDAARIEAEDLAQARSRFIAHLSHELRTPLNAVLGFSEMMKEQLVGPLSERYVDYAASIYKAGSHLLDMIGNVLDFSRIDADRYELHREEVDARDLADAALALVRVQAEEKAVALSADLPAEPLLLQADQRALKQILVNLLGNAVKFTPMNGSVALSAVEDGKDVVITVRDTGVGISANDLKRLGRPYEQAGDARQKSQGTGLGLSLARSLAELHGGTLTLESTVGEGTTATVRLPST